MSVKDASVGHGRVKRGLRRKLTCPPRLLLGKSKTKDDTEHVGKIQAWRHRGSKDASNTMEVFMPSCRENISEKLALKSTAGNPQRHSEENKERKAEEVAGENQVTAAESLPIDQSEAVADRPGHNQMTRKLSGLKQIFSPSLICLRCSGKPVERGGRDDEGERHAVMFFNRQTRDSLDLTFQSAAVRDVSVTSVQVHGSSGHQCPLGEMGTVKAKTQRLYKRLIRAPKHHSKAKTVGPDNSPKDDTPRAVCSVKKRSRPFWRHGAKKPSPFFQERIGGGTQEYIEEETIVLANKHADDPVAGTMFQCPYLDTEDKGHCPERRTVSVDVSAVSLEVKETTGEDTNASETPSHLKKDIEVMIQEPKRNLKESLIEGEKIQMNLSSLENHCGPLNNVASQCSEVDHSLEIRHRQQGVNEYVTLNVSVASSEHSTAGEEIRSCVTYNSDSNTVCQDSSVYIGTDPGSGSILGSIIANYSAIMEDLHLNPLNDVQSCNTEPSPFLKNGPDTSYCGMGHSEENSRHEFDQREILLLETACSVVQVAMNAALDQFIHELMDQ